MEIKGKTFFLSGGASGLGAATARRLARAGGNVAICDLSAEQGAALANELGPATLFVTADVTDEGQVDRALTAAQSRFGTLHGAVNCAGIAPGERILGKAAPHRLDSFRRAIEINLIGTFNVLRLAAQAMARNEPDTEGERGVIINTSSLSWPKVRMTIASR